MTSPITESPIREPKIRSLDRLSLLRRVFRCQCKRPIFFRNSQCLGCGKPLGYEPKLGRLFPLVPGAATDTWLPVGAGRTKPYKRCGNLNSPAGCNWLTPVDQALCISCRLNRTIPDLSVPENGVWWGLIEVAKRRVISSLLSLGLPLRSRVEDPEKGLAFDFLRPLEGGPPVMTGHDNGIITLNIEEADDSRREKIRAQMGEPYRTLVGHFRHELGHYYWDRLIAGSQWIDSFRDLFGDERADYNVALQNYYSTGAPADWPVRFVSAYATSHPWEDWAETWAHYFHVADTRSTAIGFGLNKAVVELQFEAFNPDALFQPEHPDAPGFLASLNEWVELTAVLNELSRGMGLKDAYPFILPKAAVAKLQFIDVVIGSARRGKLPRSAPQGPNRINPGGPEGREPSGQ